MTNDELQNHLEAIRAEAGALTPDAVVAAAEEEDHPLHSSFTWDDDIAAHAHRINQARKLIRRVRIIAPRLVSCQPNNRALIMMLMVIYLLLFLLWVEVLVWIKTLKL